MKSRFRSIMGYVLCCLLLLLCYIFVPQQMSFAECIDDHSNSLPQRIVVFPRFAEEILFELVKPEQIIYVGHEYFEEGESYWPTMSVSRFCSGNIWQNSDEEEILSMNPDLIIFSSELQIDFPEIFPEIANSDVSLLFVDTPQSVDDIIELILLLGDTVKENERAISMVDKMTSSIDFINRIVDTVPEAEHINVALYGEPNPFFTIATEMAGVNGVYCSDIDMLKQLNPDIILILPYCFDTDGSLYHIGKAYADDSIEQIKHRLKNTDIKAITEEKIYTLDFSGSQYITECAFRLIELSYPGLFTNDR